MSKNKLPDILKKEQLVRFFENVYIPKLAIACFMAVMCGLRIREVCRLEVEDIDLKERRIKIKDSKNTNRKKEGYGKDRFVPIPEVAISPIRKWLSIIEGGKWFLPSEHSPDKYLRTKTLHIWFGEIRKRAGLDLIDYKVPYRRTFNNKTEAIVYKYRFHHFRHFYAQYVYEKTRDLYLVSNLLGHNQVSTTQVYAKCSDKIKKESIDFAFNIPIKSKLFENNPVNALNYSIPTIAKRDKTPIEILEERFARGEISALDFQSALRLLKIKKDYFDNEQTKDNTPEVEKN